MGVWNRIGSTPAVGQPGITPPNLTDGTVGIAYTA
jgi:hypothetical protein